MRADKGKMELRYYDVPRNEFLLAYNSEHWKDGFGEENSGMHFHNLLEIGICRRGSGSFYLQNSAVSYTGGWISIVPPTYPHSIESMLDEDCVWEILYIDAEKVLSAIYPEDILFQQKMLQQIDSRASVVRENDIYDMAAIIRTISGEMRMRRKLYRESVGGLLQTLLIMIARYNSDTAIPDGVYHKNGFEQIRPALEYIREHYAVPMKVAEIAGVCHMSESHFRRLFEENIGMAPGEYLNWLRIKKSCDLIRKTGYSMEEIAVKVGFTTASTFNRNFKSVVGTTPYHWKKQPEKI